jgi:hypothetical protein
MNPLLFLLRHREFEENLKRKIQDPTYPTNSLKVVEVNWFPKPIRLVGRKSK